MLPAREQLPQLEELCLNYFYCIAAVFNSDFMLFMVFELKKYESF